MRNGAVAPILSAALVFLASSASHGQDISTRTDPPALAVEVNADQYYWCLAGALAMGEQDPLVLCEDIATLAGIPEAERAETLKNASSELEDRDDELAYEAREEARSEGDR